MNKPNSATRSVVIDRKLAHSADKVWRALTQGALIEEWLMKNDFQPVVGHKFAFRMAPVGGWNGVIDAEVRTVEPQKTLAYSWTSMGMETLVTWTLTPVEGGVLLRMEQSGFREDQEQNYQGAKYGWKNFIDGLERVLARSH